jgi:hypothetical protein
MSSPLQRNDDSNWFLQPSTSLPCEMDGRAWEVERSSSISLLMVEVSSCRALGHVALSNMPEITGHDPQA